VIYRVSYSSMTAHYGPHFVEAETETAAKYKAFDRGAFTPGEFAHCITAKPSSIREAQEAP
jgi:hypothetical protein